MGSYVIRRVLELLLVFFGVTLLIYFAVWALPGDPIQGMAGDRPLPATVVATLRERYRLDDPLLVQYFRYLGDLFRGDFGVNFNGRPVSELMGDRWPVTIKLALTAWVIEIVVGISLGVFSALHRGKWFDYTTLFFTVGIISVPVFVLAYALQLLLGVRAGIFPVSGITDGWPRSYLLPALILAGFGLASLARLVRTSVLENLRADYVRTAFSKGLSRRRVIVRHVLRNSLISAVTYMAINLGYLLSGAVVIEGVFNLPGIGELLFRSINSREGSVVVGISTALVLIFLVANLCVDLLYGVLDPRIRRD